MAKAVYLPFADGSWHLKLGLKALKLEEWLDLDEEYSLYVNRKRELWQSRHGQIFDALPGSEAAQQEVLELVLDYLTTQVPGVIERGGDRIQNLLTGEVWSMAEFAAAPLDLAGRLIQEDLCLMTPGSDGYCLSAAALYFPSYWRLHDKLGLPLMQIHHPVPGYGDKLGQPVDRFFERMTGDRPGYRLNWSIVDTPELFLGDYTAHFHEDETSLRPDNVGERLWIRVERQTLRRLERSATVLFTIRTYVYPLSILTQYPDAAAGLVTTLDHISPEMQHYKSLTPIRETMQQYLRTLAPLQQ